MSGVLALALKRIALSRGTVPSAVPVGQASDEATNGTFGTHGTVGPSGIVALSLSDGDRLHAERRATVRYVNAHFQSSRLGQCAHCGSAKSPANPFVAIFCGEDGAEIHSACHSAWAATRESVARAALGIEPEWELAG